MTYAVATVHRNGLEGGGLKSNKDFAFSKICETIKPILINFSCCTAHLNGEYFNATEKIEQNDDWHGILWLSWLRWDSLKSSTMMIRRKQEL